MYIELFLRRATGESEKTITTLETEEPAPSSRSLTSKSFVMFFMSSLIGYVPARSLLKNLGSFEAVKELILYLGSAMWMTIWDGQYYMCKVRVRFWRNFLDYMRGAFDLKCYSEALLIYLFGFLELQINVLEKRICQFVRRYFWPNPCQVIHPFPLPRRPFDLSNCITRHLQPCTNHSATLLAACATIAQLLLLVAK